jgi:hypothetical protein
MHHPYLPFPETRRDWLRSMAAGFGSLAFAGMADAAAKFENPLLPKKPHFPAKAKRVIFLFMQGAPSQHETFDYNPELDKLAEKDPGRALKSQFAFTRQGQSGLAISNLFPHLGQHADSLCILNGMHTDSPAHPQASVQLHTGSINFVRPSLGAWTLYGLGTENQDLPGFISIDPNEVGGAQKYGSAFMPAAFQGTPLQTRTGALPNIKNPELERKEQRQQLDLIQAMNQNYLERAQVDPEVEGLIETYELAFRMQTSVPGVLSLQGESEATKKAYGLDNALTRDFGTQCLMARRLAEKGVRFIELSKPGWDQHSNLKQLISGNCRAIDQPIAALIADLKARGMFDDTLIFWGGEFGRTPNGQGDDGRNHNARGYSVWLAGGGVKGGQRLGATDPLTGAAVEGKVHLHDLHATMLHLLGLDHKKLTYRYAGRDFRLTDVFGNVVKEIIA